MGLTSDLAQLVELRDRGDLTPAEFDRAKQRLLAPSPPVAPLPAPPSRRTQAAAPDGALLLYTLVRSWQRRTAWVLAIVGVLFAITCAWSTFRAVDLNDQAAAIQDAALAEGFGVRIPDPRPSIERGELRLRATAYGGVAIATGLVAAAALLGAALIRPPAPPPP